MFDALITATQKALESNQFLSGGLVMGGMAAAVTLSKSIPGHLYRLLKKQVVMSVQINSKDPSFNWLKAWLDGQPYSKTNNRLILSTKGVGAVLTFSDRNSDKQMPTLLMTPAPGFHFFRYQGKILWIHVERERIKEDQILTGFDENVTINVFFGKQDFMRSLMSDAYALYEKNDDGFVRIMTSQYDDWRLSTKQPMRPISTMVYDDDLGNQLLMDMRNFLSERAWYIEMGIPWRRGYLLYGPPGNGKSSLVTAAASEFGRDIYVINLSNQMSDERLQNLMAGVPKDGIVLIEEIDTIFNGREHAEDATKVSFGGLLNVLDGVGTKDGRIVFMTTNHKENLDAALIRPGRADVHLHLKNASQRQARNMFDRFYPRAEADLAEIFAQNLPFDTVSMALLQDLFIRHKDSPFTAIEEASTWSEQPLHV